MGRVYRHLCTFKSDHKLLFRLNSSDAVELFSKCTFKQLPYCFLQRYHFAFSSVMGDKLICTVPILIFGMVSGFVFFFYFIYTKRYIVYLIMALTVTLQQLMMLCRNSVFLNNWLILPGKSSELVISFRIVCKLHFYNSYRISLDKKRLFDLSCPMYVPKVVHIPLLSFKYFHNLV